MNNIPLAERLRPKSLKDFVGQENIVGKQGIIKKLLDNSKDSGFFPSLIFWGPPGSGKTTLARIIANNLKREFFEFSAVSTSTKDIEKVISNSRHPEGEVLTEGSLFGGILRSAQNDKPKVILNLNKVNGEGSLFGGILRSAQNDRKEKFSPSQRQNDREKSVNTARNVKKKSLKQLEISEKRQPIVFIDEIHRFNKAQQDKLLPHVEKGNIIFIGATTENPSFEVISPLLSRTRVIVLEQLGERDLEKILKRAIKETKTKRIINNAQKFLLEASNGDARVLLNVFEIATQISKTKIIKLTDIEEALQRRQLGFDKKGEEFYNIISSYLKSMRASNVDAALYYLARMVAAGQDPLYIARRMVVFASEDVASPTALVVANEVFRACETIGYPECQENLAAGTVYLAQAKKDRRAYEAYMSALEDVNKYGNLPVPMKIRNAPTKLMKDLGYGKGYEPYTKESLLPEKLKGRKYYLNKNKSNNE